MIPATRPRRWRSAQTWPTGTATLHTARRARPSASAAAAALSTTVAGTLSHGQGHETSYAQMVADWLGAPEDKIHLVQADTDEVALGRGT